MHIDIDSSGLLKLQKKRQAIAMARPCPSPLVGSALVFALPATRIIGAKLTISVAPTLRCFAAGGAFENFEQVVPSLYSSRVERAEVQETGIGCTFAGNAIGTESLSPPMPGALQIENGSEGFQDNLTMGLAETFKESATNSSVEAPSLLAILDSGISMTIEDLPATAYLFLISDDVPAGTVIPTALYLPRPVKGTTARMVTTTRAILVDPSNDDLTVVYNSATNGFVKI